LYSSRYIDHQTGPFGCLFPYPNFFGFQEKFLRFVWNNKVYQFLAVPFGLADAPQVFTRGFQTVISHLHTPSVQAHSYLDDSLLKEFDSEILSRHTYLFIRLLLDLGFLISWKKSQRLPVFGGTLQDRFRSDFSPRGKISVTLPENSYFQQQSFDNSFNYWAF
jgi:hypothetical protein